MSIDIDQLIAQMEWARARNLSELVLTLDGNRITLQRGPSPGGPIAGAEDMATDLPARQDPATDPPPEKGALRAPLSGTCHLTPEPDCPPYVTLGARVHEGETVCVIEAMKVMTSVAAQASGTVEAIYIESGTQIEAGAPIMKIC